MFGITPKRLFGIVLASSLFFVAVQYISVLCYASEFDDFVKDEVEFAPMREGLKEDHLVAHILEEARFYRMKLDSKNNIRVLKTRDRVRGINMLSVDVDYKIPVDLYYFTHEVPFHLHASQVY